MPQLQFVQVHFGLLHCSVFGFAGDAAAGRSPKKSPAVISMIVDNVMASAFFKSFILICFI
jgi:hypothetical protein